MADLVAKAHAESTRQAYGRHVARWLDWAEAKGVCPLPAQPDDFVEFLVGYALEVDADGAPVVTQDGDFEGRVVTGTANQLVAAVAQLHTLADLPSPLSDSHVSAVLRGLRHVLTGAAEHAKVALTWDLMEEVLAAGAEVPTASTARCELILALRACTGATAGQIARLRPADVVVLSSRCVVSLPPVRRGGRVERVVVDRGRGQERLRQALHQWQRATGGWPGETLIRHRSGKPLTRQGVHKALATRPRRGIDCRSDVSMRDRTLLLVGWNSALRRENLAALTWDQFTRVRDGWVVYIAKSKTDQERRGSTVGIPGAPEGSDLPDAAATVDQWLAHVTTVLGSDPRRMQGVRVFPRTDRHGHLVLRGGRPVPLSGAGVNEIVQRWVDAAGLNERMFATTGGMPVKPGRRAFGAHSLRAGWITEAKRQNIPDHEIVQQTGHRSVKSLAAYNRPATRPDIMAAASVLRGISRSKQDVIEPEALPTAGAVGRRRSIDWSGCASDPRPTDGDSKTGGWAPRRAGDSTGGRRG